MGKDGFEKKSERKVMLFDFKDRELKVKRLIKKVIE